MSSGSRAVNDEVTGWLEDIIHPELSNSQREFLWQYLCIYNQWSQFHARTEDLDDQVSLAYLAARAEDALRDLASTGPARLWLSVIRSLPLSVIAYIAMTNDTRQILELVKTASAAACLYGDRSPAMQEGKNALFVSAEWLETFKGRLALNVPRFIGAAHTWYYARGWYRIAGKGGKLASPAPVDLNVARKTLDSLAPDAIRVPSAIFTNNNEIMPQVQEYDRRSLEAGMSGITGVLGTDPDSDKTQADPLSWWRVGVPSSPLTPHKVMIAYPLQNITLITTSYLPIADELTPYLNRLAPFTSLMPARLGIGFELFGLCCRAVAATLRNQTGFMNLRPLPDEPGTSHFRAEHTSLEAEKLSASFLFSVMHRGLLRAPRQGWVDILTGLVSQGGVKKPRKDVETFIRLFTRDRLLDSDLQPGLFLSIDPHTLALDLLSMSEFFEFCIRKVTSLDHAPTMDARRGTRFEQAVWQFLKHQVDVHLVVDLNCRLHDGSVQGEIDIAFLVNNVLVILECKSWQKRVDYFRGDRRSIERRHEQLRRIIEEQTARNVALLLNHLGTERPRDVLSFVCVAGPEFIMRGYPGLWYGPTSRVVTPQELRSLISDTPRWLETVRASRSNPPGSRTSAEMIS